MIVIGLGLGLVVQYGIVFSKGYGLVLFQNLIGLVVGIYFYKGSLGKCLFDNGNGVVVIKYCNGVSLVVVYVFQGVVFVN